MKKLLTIEEVAELLGLQTLTVYRWAKSGQLPCVRLSARALRFNLPDIEEFVKKRTSGTTNQEQTAGAQSGSGKRAGASKAPRPKRGKDDGLVDSLVRTAMEEILGR